MPTSDTVAVIDVGSNSIKLLVAQQGKQPNNIETVLGETIETRISTGISRAFPRLRDEAMAAGLETIRHLLQIARIYCPKRIRIVATSAVRDALNRSDFMAMVNDATGITLSILSGKEEATLIGKGLSCDPRIADMHQFIQMDIGGGSLELIRFEHEQIVNAISLQLGAVRLTEHFVKDREQAIDTQTADLIQAYVRQTVQDSGFDFTPASNPMVVTGGALTVTRAVLAAKAGSSLEKFPPVLTLGQIHSLKDEIIALPLHERMAVPHLPAARADIIPSALITIETVMNLARREQLTHSFYNLRYGVAAAMLENLRESGNSSTACQT